MKIHCLQHVAFETPGALENYTSIRGFEIQRIELFNGADFPEIDEVEALVVLGGPMGVYDTDSYPWLDREKLFISEVIAKEKKVLGICLGAQLIAAALGARVVSGGPKEIGWYPVTPVLDLSDTFFTGITEQFLALHWHGDTFELPENARLLASTSLYRNQAFQYRAHVLALQFHFEMRLSDATSIAEHCSDELESCDSLGTGGMIQSREEILADPKRFEQANKIFFDVLDRLLQS